SDPSARPAHPGRRTTGAPPVLVVLVVVTLVAALTTSFGAGIAGGRAHAAEPSARAATPGGAPPIRGMVDAHAHITASPAFGACWPSCEPFAAAGIAEALADCPTPSGAGHFALLESVLGGPDLPGGNQGSPTFAQWPSHDSQLHEQAHYSGIERAWRGGLR